MAGFFRINPITRKRWRRFRKIKRGWYSLIILVTATFLSLFSNYIANHRAIVVKYNGEYYFPTFNYISMETFGQEDDWGDNTVEAEYALLQDDWQTERTAYEEELAASDGSPEALAELDAKYPNRDNWLIMPIIPYDPYRSDFWYTDNTGELPPNAPDWEREHYLGTDSQGRDVAARLLYGFRISIFFALALVLISQVIGTIIGCLQGYIGGRFDILSQRFIEVWSSLPALYILIIMATFFTPGFWILLFLMSLFQWIRITFYMRTEIYREKTREYCMAAQSYGASQFRVIFRHLLPNCLTPLVTFTPFAIVSAISLLTGLDYLGYGLPAPTPSWGELIDQALRTENRDKLWLTLSPFTALSVTLILVTFVGESVREAYDPKEYARYE
jgi:microcin C transport system permease protein